jgi:hypothetical protein
MRDESVLRRGGSLWGLAGGSWVMTECGVRLMKEMGRDLSLRDVSIGNLFDFSAIVCPSYFR